VIQRNNYLGRLAGLREKQTVKVVSGIRGSGKTTLFAMYIDLLKKSGAENAQIIYMDLEEPESDSLLHYQGLYSHIKKRLCQNKYTYVFIDGIHKCENYEKALEGLVLKKQVDLYIAVTDNESYSGIPYNTINLLPLSFSEYNIFTKYRAAGPQIHIPVRDDEKNTFRQQAYAVKKDRRLPRLKEQVQKYLAREAFNNYLGCGGFPFAAFLGSDAGLVRNCVEGIWHTVLIKDTVRQKGITNITLLEQIVQLMCRSIGRPLNSKKLSSQINAKGGKISANTAETYMRALGASRVFYHAARFDIKTGKELKTPGKYYIADPGILNLLYGNSGPELSGQLENIVYLELLRRGFLVYTGKYGTEEINFAAFAPVNPEKQDTANENKKPVYIQVTASAADDDFTEKISALEKIESESYRCILSLDDTPVRKNPDGIIRQNLIDWLLGSG